MHPFRIAAIVLGSLALLFTGFLVIGLLLPSGWQVDRSIRIDAPAEEVFPYLDRAEAWGEWTPSPETGIELFGPPRGVGSGRRWDDPGYGRGEFVITASDPPRELRYEVAVEGGAIQVQGQLLLEAEGTATRVEWREEGDFGWNPLLGYLAGRMNELQGAQLEASLATLARRIEGLSVTSAPD